MSCTILPKPSFEVGKRYRTRDGWIVKLRDFDAGSVYPLGGIFDRLTGYHWWTSEGRWCHYSRNTHERDLMPGAIEDEPEAVDPPQEYGFHTQLSNLRKQMAAQANVIACMAAKIEALDQRLNARDGLARRIVGIESRIDGVDRRIERLDGTIANLNRKIDLTHDDLSRQSRGHSRITATLGQRVEEHSDRLDRLAIELGGKVNARLAAEGMRYACTAAADRAKPTIKGGWVNVYCDFISRIHQTKAEADGAVSNETRLACIQIPDITEGEGL
jgi:uncharacterized coiled-coil protein SlyX